MQSHWRRTASLGQRASHWWRSEGGRSVLFWRRGWVGDGVLETQQVLETLVLESGLCLESGLWMAERTGAARQPSFFVTRDLQAAS